MRQCHQFGCSHTPYTITKVLLALLIGVFFSFIFGWQITQAQTSCGDLVDVTWNGPFLREDEGERTPITNCSDPFMVTTDPVNPYSAVIAGQVAENGGIVMVPGGETREYEVTGEYYQDQMDILLFKHVGADYTWVNTEESDMTNTDYESFALSYFTNEAIRSLYLEIFHAEDVTPYMYAEDWTPLYDSEGYSIEERYWGFVSAAENAFVPVTPALGVGTYTFVVTEYTVILNAAPATWWARLASNFIPVAHAQFGPPPYRYTLTFTIEEGELEPAGASSVLFLPGIQASRLYKADSVGGGEDQVWPPNAVFTNDIYDLSMSVTGVSVEDIFTRDVIDSTAGVGDIYTNFQNFLDDLQEDEIIDNWNSYPYDWRYSVDDVAENGTRYEEGLRDLVEEIEFLAEDSFSDKVTIIGHSNGGLLAKALMKRLESEGKTDLVDRVVLLASPQLGTPKAIGTILHGYDQTDSIGGIVTNAQVARTVINNLPGAYGLLPSAKYFEGLSEPLVSFNNSPVTADYRATYGNSISGYTDAIRFIRGNDGLNRSLTNPANVPTKANGGMLDNALAMHQELDGWVAPEGVEVIEIVGTGLPTMKSVEYKEVTETKCPLGVTLISGLCTKVTEMKPYALFTHYGDGTVVQRSAEGYVGEKKKYFVNLKDFNLEQESEGKKSIFHHSVTEAEPIQELLLDIILGSTTDSTDFITTSYTTFTDEYDIEIIDSPVRLLATDTEGNQTGTIMVGDTEVIKEEIPGSQYFEFGESKYLIVPKGTDRTTKLYGESYGGYTLTVASLNSSGSQSIQTSLKNATVTPTMIVEYENIDEKYSNIKTDLNGDGITDQVTTMTGAVVQVITYPVLIAKIQSSSLSKLHKLALLVPVKGAEEYAKKLPQKKAYKVLEKSLLVVAEELVKAFMKNRQISAQEGSVLLQMIEEIRRKI